jgi:hypothetical protein
LLLPEPLWLELPLSSRPWLDVGVDDDAGAVVEAAAVVAGAAGAGAGADGAGLGELGAV